MTLKGESESQKRRSPVAVYRPTRTDGLPPRALQHLGDPVVEVVIQIGHHVLDPPLGFAIFEDGQSVLVRPDDLGDWDGTFSVSRPNHQSRR